MATARWIVEREAGLELNVRVTPRASRNAIEASPEQLKVRVTAPADAGKANAAVIKQLAKRLGVPKSAIRIVRGQTARQKVLAVADISAKEVQDALAA